MKVLSTLISALALCAASASAHSTPSVSHDGSTITLGYNFHNDADGAPFRDNFTTQLTAASKYSFGANFGAAVSLVYNKEQHQSSFYSERYLIDVNPYYDLGAGSVGVFYTAIAYYDGDSETHAQYGVTADYKTNGMGFEAYAGLYEEDRSFAQDTYGIAVSYDVTDAAMIYISERRDVSDGDSYGLTAIGGTYDLANLTGNLPISIRAEVSGFHDNDNTLSEGDWTQFSLMASYSFGDGAESIFRGVRAVNYYYD